jgi:hypothetical protein
VKEENGDLLADSHHILTSQLLNVHNVSDVRQIITVEPLISGPSSFWVEITTLKKYTSLGSDHTPAELIQAGGDILLSAIHKHINSIWNKEEFHDQCKESVPVCLIFGSICRLPLLKPLEDNCPSEQ